ncbi:MAG: hypothetical protein HYR91_07270 [Flavobacteriia bacterium]|nr:hypothetical protein [Flavobacteriia bacterium]
MKTIFLFLILFCSLLSFGQINKVDAKGKKQGAWQKNYPKSKVLQYKGQFINDKPVGTFTYYYPSNKISAIIIHTPNTSRARAEFYFESGSLMSKGNYINQKKDSIWVNYEPAGCISFIETYKNDVLNGLKVIYFIPQDINDRILRIYLKQNFTNGKLEGESIEYFDNGIVKKTGNYKNNVKIGVWENYHPNGKMMMLERYKNGIMHGWFISYDEDGNETGRKYYYNGTPLEGKELELKLKQMKAKGINPNE